MKKLIIVTGISGSGKTTISNYIYNHYKNSTIISMDTLKEDIYDIVGFNNNEQKQNLKPIIYNTFMELLNECMKRNDENIIIEYPFNNSWENEFKKLVDKYNYNAITIKVKGKDYDTIFQRLNNRNNNSKRHPSHSLTSYNLKEKDKYKSTNELDYKELKYDYETDKYTSINVGREIIFINDNSNYNYLIEQIDGDLSDF